MQICISAQTDKLASIPPLSFLQARCPSCCPTNSIKALTYWPGKYVTGFTPHNDNFHQTWSWYNHLLLNYSILATDTLRDIDLLSFDSGHTWQVTCTMPPPSLNILGLLSYDVSQWLPLTMYLQPLCMHQITWPVYTRSKIVTYLDFSTTVCLFTMQLILGYDDDQGPFTI